MKEKILFNDNWLFHKGDLYLEMPKNKGAMYMQSKVERFKIGPFCKDYYAETDSFDENFEYKIEKWDNVCLPHDFQLDEEIDRNENNALGFVKQNNGYYIKKFYLDKSDKNKRITILFEGVAVESVIVINGCLIKRNFSAYNSFEVDITDFVSFDKENRLVVYCKTSLVTEGWWYQGGGIYRNVYLIKSNLVSVDLYGVFVKTFKKEDKWKLEIETTVRNDFYNSKNVKVRTSLIDDGVEKCFDVKSCRISQRDKKVIISTLETVNPSIWSLENPNMCYIKTEIYSNGILVDEELTRFGFRTYKIENDKFYINDKECYIKGICSHNYGSRLFGLAVPDNIAKYKIKLLKDTGFNAYRTAHYMQSSATMDALDEQGFIVMDETRWFSSDEESKKQLEVLIKRDRNRPSVFFYSIGNEEPATQTELGLRIGMNLIDFVRKLDDTKLITLAVSYSPELSPICSKLDVIGINYNFCNVEKVREKYPNKPILFSEFCACPRTRGWYHDDALQFGKKSAIRDDTIDWTFKSREYNYKFLKEHGYMLGGFAWVGFEYQGETQWPRLGSCSALFDINLQKKESAYQTESYIKDKPMIYLMPHWNYQGQEGKPIMVKVYSNCEMVELYLNDKLVGSKELNYADHYEVEVPYEQGKLVAKGYINGKCECEYCQVTTGKIASIKVKLDNEDVKVGEFAHFTCSAFDENGNEIYNAEPIIKVAVDGVGSLYSTAASMFDHISPFNDERKMYQGKMSFAVKINSSGRLVITVESEGIDGHYFIKDF